MHPVKRIRRRRLWLLAIPVCVLVLLVPSAAPGHAALDAVPDLVLWAWERPEDLRGIDQDIAVAFLAQTITITPDGIDVAPRRQPLRVSDRTRVIAVTRVETALSARDALSSACASQTARAIASTAVLPRVVAVQVDFDAVRSERPFYRALVRMLRETLDARTGLSMTALASWCMEDNWIEGLPVDEAVPMLFRMGPYEQRRQRQAAAGTVGRACRSAVGLSLDEPVSLRAAGKRVYVFSPTPWTEPLIAHARRMVTQ
jgi:hypothetical protein